MTGSRPSKSSTSIGRRSLTCTWPEAISSSAGRVFTTTGKASSARNGDAPLAAQRRRRGEQHLLDVLLGDQLGDLLGPRHFQAVHELAGKRGVGIDEGDGLVTAGLVQRAQQLDAERAGAVDDDRLPLIEARRLVLRRRREQRRAPPIAGSSE